MKAGAQLLILGLLVGLGACQSPPPQPFRFQMDWTHEVEYAGFYAAQSLSLFRKSGLDVTLLEGPAGTDVPAILASGNADAAQMGMTMYLDAVAKDADLVAVMAVYQTSPRVLLTLSGRNIQAPREIQGLRVGIKSASWAALVKKILANDGADPGRIVEVPVRGQDVDRFYRGDIDVWTGFATAEPVEARLSGHPVNLMFADDYGAGGYDELIVVKRSSLEKDPGKYRRFLKALLGGWAWAIDHGDETVRLLDGKQPQETHEFHTLAWKALQPLVATGRNPIGWIENARWPKGIPFTTDLLERP